jgi:hypothetical protein
MVYISFNFVYNNIERNFIFREEVSLVIKAGDKILENGLIVSMAINYILGNGVLSMIIIWLIWKDTLPPHKAELYVKNLWIILGFANLYWVDKYRRRGK